MNGFSCDAAVIGAGAAGMAAALSLHERGKSVMLIDREEAMGGILLQCIHNGFGLQHFGEELTGPEFASRFEQRVRAAGIPFRDGTTVLSLERTDSGFALGLSSSRRGYELIECRAVVLAMGSRERNRGNIRIAGSRPAGVFTAGLAQRLLNIDGYVPGKKAVIIGSGDIGLIMARRMTLSGAEVAAVVEIQSSPSGLTRNIAQCLNDFDIPLHLSHATLRILGRDRVTGVEIAPMENGAVQTGKSFVIGCDTVLLSVGLVPENELSARTGVALSQVTNGPLVDSRLMTSVPGVFAAGNVLHIHDLVDRVAEEAIRAGKSCADWLDSAGEPASGGHERGPEIPLRAGTNVRYAVPSSFDPSRATRVSLRSLVPFERARLVLTREGREVWSRKLSWVTPGEMIACDIPAGLSAGDAAGQGACTVSLTGDEGGSN